MSSSTRGLTIDKMIQFVGVVERRRTASSIRTYQIEATGKIVGGSRRADLAQELEEHAGDPQHLPRDWLRWPTHPSSSSRTPRPRRHCRTRRPRVGDGDRRHCAGAAGPTQPARAIRHRATLRPLSNAPKTAIVPRSRTRRVLINVRAHSASASTTLRRPGDSRNSRAASFANLTASSLSCSGATITSSDNAAAAAHVAFDRRPAVAQQDRDLARAVAPAQLQASGAAALLPGRWCRARAATARR